MTITTIPARCINADCGHPLRSGKDTLKDFPGTRPNQGGGVCSACYSREWRARKAMEMAEDAAIEMEPIDSDRIEKMRNMAIDYHRGWRRRNGLDVNAPIDLREIVMA